MTPFRRSILVALVVLTLTGAGWFYIKSMEIEEPGAPPTAENLQDEAAYAEPMEGAPPGENEDEAGTGVDDQMASSAQATVDPLIEKRAEIIRSAVKAALQSIYSAEKNFFAEYGRYTTDIRLAGWDLPRQEIDFKLGFLSPSSATEEFQNENPREMDTDAFVDMGPDEDGFRYVYSPFAEGVSLIDFASRCEKGCTTSDDGFEVIAAFRISPEAKVEAWKIDDKNQLLKITE